MGASQNCPNKFPDGENINLENNRSQCSMLATSPVDKPSMSSLILWNVTKALEKNPHMDLKSGIKAAQEGLECNAIDLNVVRTECPERLHLACAILAWQQLGHKNVESLYQFIEAEKKNNLHSSGENSITRDCNLSMETSDISHDKDIISLDNGNVKNMSRASSMGPVIKLPQTEVIMRCQQCQTRKIEGAKISKQCTKPEPLRCPGSACSKKLSEMGAATEQLRARLASLAKREAEKVKILERAEAAWGELERGYQRRLALAEEREDDISRQLKKTIEDRNANKNACTVLAKQLKQIGDAAEKEQATLKLVERELCNRECERLSLSKEIAETESVLTDQQVKLIQLDRDLQFKEEQARRKLLAIDGETESARILSADAERALRGELAGLRQQIEQVSAQLLEEDNVNKQIKDELEQLRQEKDDMVEDLEGCKAKCDARMQSKLDEVNMKREQLQKLKEKVIDCQCKVPVDAAVTVQRTPSLAALCKCSPEDRFLESCSCTSLRSRLLSDLLADLFAGLQSEMGTANTQMPCQLLKCLEEKHNWNRSSVVKTNLRNFFSKLLIGELDIAIATSIENYHAKWVGASCADVARMTPGPKDELGEGWEQRAIEKRAQKLAEQLAEQLFEKRADELTKHAKEIVTSGPPPCECGKIPKKSDAAAVLSCLTESLTPFQHRFKHDQNKSPNLSKESSFEWEITQQEVADLKFQIEDLKKKSINKQDLIIMEKKIIGIVKQAAETDTQKENVHGEVNKKYKKNTTEPRGRNVDESSKRMIPYKSGGTKRKVVESSKKGLINEKPTKQPKKYDHNQAYAVNVCMCGPNKVNKSLQRKSLNANLKSSSNEKKTSEKLHQAGTLINPINTNVPTSGNIESFTSKSYCEHKCKRLEKTPSTSSIDKLLETLTKWKYDLENPQEINMDNIKRNSSRKSYLDYNYSSFTVHKSKEDARVGFIDIPAKTKEDGSYETEKQTQINPTTVFQFHEAVNSAPLYVSAVNMPKIKRINESDSKNKIEIHESYQDSFLKDPINFFDKTQLYEPSKDLDSKDFQIGNILNEGKKINDNNTKTTILNTLANSQGTSTFKSEEIKEKSKKIHTGSQINTISTILMKKKNSSKELICSKKCSTNLFTNNKNKTEIVPKDIDYYIKFLGVTLADTEDHELIQNKDKICNRNKMCQLVSQRLANASQNCNSVIKEINRDMLNTLGNRTKQNLPENSKIFEKKNLNYDENNIEQCVCCTTKKVSSKDMEENAFHLLEDYLKQRLKDVKACSCAASCFSPEDEEKIFSTILERVRRVISNCTNEYKCTEREGSWKRAYGLLREYLKIKMKRVQGLQFSSKNNEVILPDILSKVCNLIDDDFERLKELCKCKNKVNFIKKDTHREDTSDSAELPDTLNLPVTSFSLKEYLMNALRMFTENRVKSIENVQNISCQVSTKIWMSTKSCGALRADNSFNHLLRRQNMEQNSSKALVLTHTTSAQVSRNLHMATKSCNVIEIPPGFGMENQFYDNLALLSENKHTTSFSITNKDYKRKVVSHVDYDWKNDPHCEALELCRNNEILLDLYADILMNYDINTKIKRTTKTNVSAGFVNSLPDLKISQFHGNKTSKKDIIELPAKQPHLNSTVRCTYNDNFCMDSYVDTNSVVESNCNEMDQTWKQFSDSKSNNSQDLSCIDNSNENETTKYENDIMETLSTSIEGHPKGIEYTISTIDTSDCIQNEDNLVSNAIMSKCNINTVSRRLRTVAESERQESLSSSPYSHDDVVKSSDAMTTITCKPSFENCECNRVPICHVKMLVKNIEQNLLLSRCTCDSISKACPVHSMIISQNLS